MSSLWVVGGILVYIAFGCLGWMAIPWSMMAELFPHEVRSLAQPLNSSTAHIFMFAMLQLYPTISDLTGTASAVWVHLSRNSPGLGPWGLRPQPSAVVLRWFGLEIEQTPREIYSLDQDNNSKKKKQLTSQKKIISGFNAFFLEPKHFLSCIKTVVASLQRRQKIIEYGKNMHRPSTEYIFYIHRFGPNSQPL